MKCNSSKIEASLSKKGFRCSKNTHHKYYAYYSNGKKTGIVTFISHGKKDYGSILLSKMKKQLKLQDEEFQDLIKCPLSKEKLEELYIERGLI